MNGARQSMLDKIRRSLGRGELPAADQNELRRRISEPEQGLRPAYEQDPTARFVEKLQAVSGTVSRVSTILEVASAVQRYLEQHRLEPSLVMSGDDLLNRVEWPGDWHIERRPARDEDRVSVTGAIAAIAETGSVALASGPHSPTSLNFLPEDHIAVVYTDQVVAHIEDLWCLLRKQEGNAAGDPPTTLPRTVNLVTGPSRTADVEQTIQLGAHGPRRFHVVLVGQ